MKPQNVKASKIQKMKIYDYFKHQPSKGESQGKMESGEERCTFKQREKRQSEENSSLVCVFHVGQRKRQRKREMERRQLP